MMVMLVALVVTGYTVKAQCNKTVEWSGSKMELVDNDGKVIAAMEDQVKAVISKTEVTLFKGGGDESIGGKITSSTCNWTEPFKTGSSVIKADIIGRQGEIKPSTITLEAREGKIFLWVEMDGRKTKVTIDKYEEKS